MLRTLRSRLLASYAFVLILTLAVTGLTLLIVLRSRTIPTEEISQRLANTMLSWATRADLTNIPTDGITRRQQVRLTTFARTAQLRNLVIRVLVVNVDGRVSYDSREIYRPGDRIILTGQEYSPAYIPTDEALFATVTNMSRGTFRNPDGAEWQYVATLLDPEASNGWAYLLAVPAPRQLSLPQIFQYYGDDILMPLSQAGLIGLIIAMALSVVITRWVSRPLQEVANAAGALAKGTQDRRAPVSGPQEARIVAEAFNQMADEVSAAQQAQRDFLANVTHDLRTPLTSIQGFSQAIMDGVASDPQSAKRAAQIIHDESARMNRMVEELLDMARIEAGRFEMTRHTVNMDELLNGLAERMTPKAADKGLTLVSELTPLPTIAGDGDRLVQVFTNLVENAIKHTPNGGKVILRAAMVDLGILVKVIDTGEGIPATDLPRVFDRFYQVDKSRQRGKSGGAGLGLAIARQIVEAHGGKIWAESIEGTGAAFSVWLPAPSGELTTLGRRRTGVFKRPA